jgi:hypothetical protein
MANQLRVPYGKAMLDTASDYGSYDLLTVVAGCSGHKVYQLGPASSLLSII